MPALLLTVRQAVNLRRLYSCLLSKRDRHASGMEAPTSICDGDSAWLIVCRQAAALIEMEDIQ